MNKRNLALSTLISLLPLGKGDMNQPSSELTNETVEVEDSEVKSEERAPSAPAPFQNTNTPSPLNSDAPKPNGALKTVKKAAPKAKVASLQDEIRRCLGVDTNVLFEDISEYSGGIWPNVKPNSDCDNQDVTNWQNKYQETRNAVMQQMIDLLNSGEFVEVGNVEKNLSIELKKLGIDGVGRITGDAPTFLYQTGESNYIIQLIPSFTPTDTNLTDFKQSIAAQIVPTQGGAINVYGSNEEDIAKKIAEAIASLNQ